MICRRFKRSSPTGHARRALACLVAACLALAGATTPADTWTYRTSGGGTVTIKARLVRAAEKLAIFELSDGQYTLTPRRGVIGREQTGAPAPLGADNVAEGLEKRFGSNLFRCQVQEPFVVGLVLESPLPSSSEGRAKAFLRSVTAFMNNVDRRFGQYVEDARLEAKDPRHPLVVLIFESPGDFQKYVEANTLGASSSDRVIAMYSPISNHLAVRMDQCRTVDLVLNQAIHQQARNRGLFPRLAPVPKWFTTGLAFAFEATGGKIRIAPGMIHPLYARLALEATNVDYAKLSVDDGLFSDEDVLGEAYGHAWGLHWLLLTKYKQQYQEYMRLLAKKKPLAEDSPEQRRADFRKVFGKDPADMQEEFLDALRLGVKQQGISLTPPQPTPGYSTTYDKMAEVKLKVLRTDTAGTLGTSFKLEAEGTITNVSPLRPRAYQVTLEHASGLKLLWAVPNLAPLQTRPLAHQFGTGTVGVTPASTFRVRIETQGGGP